MCSHEDLIQRVVPGSRLLRAWPLKGDISTQMMALEIEHRDGLRQKMVLRQPSQGAPEWNPKAAQHEFEVLEADQRFGLSVPVPLHLGEAGDLVDQPRFSSSLSMVRWTFDRVICPAPSGR